MSRLAGPGPNEYTLPTTVGYLRHDATKYRSPSYTIAPKNERKKIHGFGPGLYDIDSTTRFGAQKGPAYTLRGYTKEPKKQQFPAPNTYSPHEIRKENAPKYSMGKRTQLKPKKPTPSPNQYTLPPVLGPKVPDKPTIGAISIGRKGKEGKFQKNPAPNTYNLPSLNKTKRQMPNYTIRQKVYPPEAKNKTPAPNTYKVKSPKKHGWTFGYRPSSARITYFTLDDIFTPIIQHK